LSEAYRLAWKADRLLSEIDRFSAEIDVDRLRKNRRYLFETYRTLTADVKQLETLRDSIEFRRGVYAPPSLPPATPYQFRTSRWEEKPPSEISSLMHYAKIRSGRISAVKAAIDRLRAALAAHRIAINNLIEYCALVCQVCGKVVRGKVACKVIGTNECPNCASANLSPVINEAGVFRLELIPQLPLPGDYMKRLVQMPSYGRAAYIRIIGCLRERAGRSTKSLLITIRVQIGERTVRRRISLSGEIEDAEAMVRERFGSNARIESIRYRRTQPVLINDRYTRISIALGYAILAYKTWVDRRDIAKKLSDKIDVEKTLLKLPLYVLGYDLTRYLLLKSPRARRKFVSIFPYFQSNPQFSQIEPILSILNDHEAALASRTIGLTGGLISLRAIQLKLIVESGYEAKIRKLGLVSSGGLAAAMLYLTSKYTLTQAADFFGAEVSDITKALEKMAQADFGKELSKEEKQKLAEVEVPMTQRALKFIQALGETT